MEHMIRAVVAVGARHSDEPAEVREVLAEPFLARAPGRVEAMQRQVDADRLQAAAHATGFAAFGLYALARARYPDRDPSS